jgi:aminoglycoside phosphotransferase (APT) family kinase protein
MCNGEGHLGPREERGYPALDRLPTATMKRMDPGDLHPARCVTLEPRRSIAASALQQILASALPGRRVLEIQPLTDGVRNANFKLRLNSAPELVVLRIYEHDASLCQKEIDLRRLVGGSVPVAEVIHAEPLGLDDIPPFMLMSYIEGITLLALKRAGDQEAIAQAARSAGETLAAIGRIAFPKPGWLGPGPAVTVPLLEGADAMPRFVDLCLASPNLQVRMPGELRDRIHALMWSYDKQLDFLDNQTCLVHGDFSRRNLLVERRGESWEVKAVLDWEFAVSGSPLADMANFLRYERALRPLAEPHFSAGYLQAGGALPDDWRRLMRLVDLVALCEMLTRDQLPDAVATELVEIVRATVEDRDPQLT